MKGKLEFKLPEEQEEFKVAQEGGAWKSVVWEVDQWLRNKLKHGEMDGKAAELLQEVRDLINAEADGAGLVIYN